MWNWLFSKVIKVREKVALDLGDNDPEKPFLEHLEDLRTMLIRMALTIAVATMGTFFFCKDFVGIVLHPLHQATLPNGTELWDHVNIVGLDPTAIFMTAIRVSMTAGMVLSFPLLFYFLLQFILPGMRTTEKKMILPALGIGAGLFITGLLFAYFLVVPRMLLFFYTFGANIIGTDLPGAKRDMPYIWNIVEYTKLISQFCLIFGACFELPVVVMALVKLGILTYPVMKGSRSYAVVAIAVAACAITPTTDVFTLGLLAVPMYTLYEICIWLAWWMEKRDRELHPDYYKGLDEDLKAVEATDDWDNESYNPWHDDTEEEELASKPMSPGPHLLPPSGTVIHDVEAAPLSEPLAPKPPASESPPTDSSPAPADSLPPEPGPEPVIENPPVPPHESAPPPAEGEAPHSSGGSQGGDQHKPESQRHD